MWFVHKLDYMEQKVEKNIFASEPQLALSIYGKAKMLQF